MPYFSVIVPVYNRRSEVSDLMQSLAGQSDKDFEAIIVEDGSTERCQDIVEKYTGAVDCRYYWKENEGRSIARNYGIERARGQYFIFFDSDCVIPADYFKTLKHELAQKPVDCFGGPDAASNDFNDTQKAISFSMTAFLTTGGIRGGKVHLEKFVPRSFNMGYSRKVWETVGGFREMFSEDIDMSTRIRKAGFSITLFRDCYVYHKRRNTLRSFARQTYVFGMSRITLKLLYPDSLKLVHTLPAVFVAGSALLIVLAIVWHWWCVLPLALYIAMLWVSAAVSTRSLKIACLAVVTSLIQLGSYGCGFIKAYVWKIMLRHGRNIDEEIALRKGK
ncbi:MAG: glycosyltransferase [Sodaliphilus pleomorphus]|uniref:glycosyltransferase n=1 Tax=Sodaliphilus pleomorphus TaxID=2606626 RepID=UPI002408F2EB|nr:glycosyltransferase [Sodaliphilus pleomorphus]MDD6474252.1 glycosyltransferase [Sodaliphilus pleomorphus]MDD6686979.1 glycosyltransferase [Sodaliphilus pleomorphus]